MNFSFLLELQSELEPWVTLFLPSEDDETELDSGADCCEVVIPTYMYIGFYHIIDLKYETIDTINNDETIIVKYL